MRQGCDSAQEPSIDQVQVAANMGLSFWCFYIDGPGAKHNWSTDGIATVRAGGMLTLPIYVPALTADETIASTTPAQDAEAFIAAYQGVGVNGAGALDTEEPMRGDAATAPYTEQFCSTLKANGQADICYAGGFTVDDPPQSTYKWWIDNVQDPAPNECWQAYKSMVAGCPVDMDFAGDDFPLAHFVTPDPGGRMEYFTTNGNTYVGGLAWDGTKVRPVGLQLVGNALVAYQSAVKAGTRPAPIPDVQNGLYNYYFLANTNP